MKDETLKVTKFCEVCQYQYGLFRPQCSACGAKNHTVESTPQKRAAVKGERQRKPGECIFCRRRKAKDVCPHCDEPIHHNCLGLHAKPCAEFQVLLLLELKRVNA